MTDHLFEVAVEVNFTQDLEEPWDNLARSLLVSVKDLVCHSTTVHVKGVICNILHL